MVQRNLTYKRYDVDFRVFHRLKYRLPTYYLVYHYSQTVYIALGAQSLVDILRTQHCLQNFRS